MVVEPDNSVTGTVLKPPLSLHTPSPIRKRHERVNSALNISGSDELAEGITIEDGLRSILISWPSFFFWQQLFCFNLDNCDRNTNIKIRIK